MRFTRRERHPYTVTVRKRAGVLVSQRKARERLPLLADLNAEAQPSVDEVMEARVELSARHEREARELRARKWREGRAKLARLPANERGIALAYWNGHRWLPGDPSYLLDMLHSLAVGRLTLDKMQESLDSWALRARDFHTWAAKVRETEFPTAARDPM